MLGARARLSNPLPLHPLIHHQPHPILKLNHGPGRNRCDFGDVEMESVMQRDDLALHAGCHQRGPAFDLDGFILPDDGVADLDVDAPGVNRRWLFESLPERCSS